MKGNCGECERRYFCEIDPDECDEWADPAPQTNADRIRAMSGEELVDLFGHNSICDYVQDHSSEHCEKQGSCDKCLLEWLKQPCEGD